MSKSASLSLNLSQLLIADYCFTEQIIEVFNRSVKHFSIVLNSFGEIFPVACLKFFDYCNLSKNKILFYGVFVAHIFKLFENGLL